MLPARRFDAREALALGLLARAVPPEGLQAAVEEEVRQLLGCAPGAVADAKRLIARLGGGGECDLHSTVTSSPGRMVPPVSTCA